MATTAAQATLGTYSPNIDTASRIRLEAALSEGIVEIIRRYDGLPIQPGYVPYFVDLLVSVDPLKRRQPYDMKITIDFCVNPKGNSEERKTCLPHANRLYVITLESSEALEGKQQQVASNIVRQLSLQVGASAQNVAVNGHWRRFVATRHRRCSEAPPESLVSMAPLAARRRCCSRGLVAWLGA